MIQNHINKTSSETRVIKGPQGSLRIAEAEKEEEAVLSSTGMYTSFEYNDRTIRFKTSPYLEKYTAIKEWNHGFIVVMAKYSTEDHEEEEYIDLLPILENLYIDADKYLKNIKRLRISYEK